MEDGEWKRDYPLNGKGVYHGTYRGNKIKLEGEWVNGKMEGFGKWTFKGDELWWYYYEGDFKNNEFHGQGKMIANKKVTKDMLRDSRLGKLKGLTFIGEFKNAKLFNVKSFDDNGEQKNISVSNGIFSGM